jgi:3-dehydroquinate synthetase
MFPAAVEQQLKGLYRHTGLLASVQQAPCFAPEALLRKMKQDKKNRDANIRLVLPSEQPGKVLVRDDVPDSAILEILAET